MKLRTKITAAAAAVIVLTAAVSDAIIWMICRQSLMQEAEQTAYRNLSMLHADLEMMRLYAKTLPGDTEIQYQLKKNADDYAVCLRESTELYNQTVLTADDLYSVEYSPYAQNTSFSHGRLQYAGHRLLIASVQSTGNVMLYYVSDLSSVYRRLWQLALIMAAILIGITAAAGVLLHRILRRTFKPLQVLTDSAKQIAAGAYDERAAVSGADEVGGLAEEFNRMADAVQEKIAALAESEQQKTMFMADFSHELKTPLTAISGYAQTLRTVKLSEEDQAEALGYIYSESRRLDRLAKKMMRLMELDRTESLQMTEIDCAKLLNAAADTCKPFAEKKSVTLKIAECSGQITGEFDLLHDALCNLTDNAVKASAAGQTVILSANGHEIAVQDFGCGIPPEEIQRITEPFYMVDKSRDRKSGGAGLGLSLTAQIVRLHGAELKIESTVGAGTRVILQFVYAPLNT